MSFSPAFPRMPAATPLPAPPLPGTGDRWALFLDVDGTLLEFAERAGDVRVDPELYALLAELFAHSVKPEFVYRHTWAPHDLVFWDNRSLMHLAAGTPDHLRRKLYRTTIQGDTPF